MGRSFEERKTSAVAGVVEVGSEALRRIVVASEAKRIDESSDLMGIVVATSLVVAPSVAVESVVVASLPSWVTLVVAVPLVALVALVERIEVASVGV